MVKIPIDSENYDKLNKIVSELDSKIANYEKMLNDNPRKLFDIRLPETEGALRLRLLRFKDEPVLEKELSRNDIRKIKKLSSLFVFSPKQKEKKVGRPKNELRSGRPLNTIKMTSVYSNILQFPKLIFILKLFKSISYSDENEILTLGSEDNEIINTLTKLTNKSIKLLNDYLKSNLLTSPYNKNIYVVCGLTDSKDAIIFRFKDTIVNYALFIRFDKITELFLKEDEILKKMRNEISMKLT